MEEGGSVAAAVVAARAVSSLGSMARSSISMSNRARNWCPPRPGIMGDDEDDEEDGVVDGQLAWCAGGSGSADDDEEE